MVYNFIQNIFSLTKEKIMREALFGKDVYTWEIL